MEIARAAAGVACSKEHQKIYAEWFALADPGKEALLPLAPTLPPKIRGGLMLTARAGGSVADSDGRVTGADATSFFGMSALSRADLKQVSTGPLVSSCFSPGLYRLGLSLRNG